MPLSSSALIPIAKGAPTFEQTNSSGQSNSLGCSNPDSGSEEMLFHSRKDSGVITYTQVDLNEPPSILTEFASLRKEYADLSEEEKDNYVRGGVTFPDKHGNPLRLIYELVMVGVLDITPEQYNNLKIIYKRHDERLKKLDGKKITDPDYQFYFDQVAEDIGIFKGIVKRLPVYNHLDVRELGDMFGDRGYGDHFSWFVFHHLKKHKVLYGFVDSNHDNLMMQQYEQGFKKILSERGRLGGQMREDADRSLVNLGIALKHEIIGFDEIAHYIETDFIPYVKPGAFDVISQNKTDIYFHAPVDHLVIEGAAEDLGVLKREYDDITDVIDQMDSPFREKIKRKKLHTLDLSAEKRSEFYNTQRMGSGEPIFMTPGARYRNLIWSRPTLVVNTLEQTQDEFRKSVAGLDIRSHLCLQSDKKHEYTFYHGHVGEQATIYYDPDQRPDPRYQNLDTNLGKTMGDEKGTLRFAYCGSHGPILKQIGKTIRMPRSPNLVSLLPVQVPSKSQLPRLELPKPVSLAEKPSLESNQQGWWCLFSFFRSAAKKTPRDVNERSPLCFP